MADFLTLNVPMALSKREASYNTMKTLGTDMVSLVSSALNISLPQLERFYDEALVGSGVEFARQSTPDFLSHPSITVSDRLNTDLAAILFSRALAGAITGEIVTAAESFDYTTKQEVPTDDPAMPSSTVAIALGGLKVLLGGMVVNTFDVSFSDSAAPTFSAGLIGSGKFQYWADVTPNPLVASGGTNNMPAYTVQNYMGSSAAIECSLDDGAALALHTVGRLKSFNFSLNNNLITNDRRAGDSFRTSGDINSGAYVGRLTRGPRSVSASLQVYVDGNKREWDDHLNNVHITNLIFKAVGQKLSGGPDSHEFEIKIPKACFTTAQVNDDGGKLILSLDVMPLLDTANSEPGVVQGRVRNGSATWEDTTAV